MTLLSLDIGKKRIGSAVSDESETFALPLKVIDSKNDSYVKNIINNIICDYKISKIIVGLPVSLSGEKGFAVDKTMSKVKRLLKNIELPIVYQDERYSTFQAKQKFNFENLKQSKKNKTKKKVKIKNIDALAAANILQSYLNKNKSL